MYSSLAAEEPGENLSRDREQQHHRPALYCSYGQKLKKKKNYLKEIITIKDYLFSNERKQRVWIRIRIWLRGFFPPFVWLRPKQMRSVVQGEGMTDLSLWGRIIPVTNHHPNHTWIRGQWKRTSQMKLIMTNRKKCNKKGKLCFFGCQQKCLDV